MCWVVSMAAEQRRRIALQSTGKAARGHVFEGEWAWMGTWTWAVGRQLLCGLSLEELERETGRKK